MNFAVGGAERGSRRCGACAADDRNRNESRPCLCCHVSPGGVPCGAHDSHLGGECTGIAVPGSKDCAECTAERKANRTFCDCDHMYCHLGDEVDASLAERQRVGAPHAGRLTKLWSLPTQVCLSIRFTTAVARLTHNLFSLHIPPPPTHTHTHTPFHPLLLMPVHRYRTTARRARRARMSRRRD